MPPPFNILHMHSSFDLGGKEARAVQLMNAFGDRARHTIVSGMPDQLSARDAIAKGIQYEIAQNPPPLTGRPSVSRFEAIARFMRRFDLVLSYNWGAIDAVMAKRAFPKSAPPIVHHEDGFNADEAERLKARRTVYRRLAFAAAHSVVVPSVTLEYLAQQRWKLSAPQLRRIPNGIPTALYARQPDPKAIPGFARKPGEIVVGAIAGLRAVKNLPALVRAVGGCSAKIRLVIVGEGPERAAIESTAANMGLTDQLVMPGFLPEPYRYVGLFDILALSSLSEQFPISVVEGMAAGLPIAAPNVGDMLHMVSYENRNSIDQHRNEVGLRDVIEWLAQNPAARAALGKANRAKAVAEYDETVMIDAYRALYEEASGRVGALT
ncbi:glycosyltransferase family 4 protein [Sphingomonas sp.]|jgi:glycosyltransferase involved in cell wall biosynthesis|uniref:glycosyltransferase family 4 protein n=1 Tax=Sphingomonas sp. TaxID=28214 RepID=UPI002E367CAC|nr:glycosyltransferase family 4 protein [Sphingomonas sp.]HEX4694143.1 glycosyltransferase family 4 protein [Sphingomonas sp.]